MTPLIVACGSVVGKFALTHKLLDEQYLRGTLQTVARFSLIRTGKSEVLFGDANFLLNPECVPISYRKKAIIPMEINHLRVSHLPTLSCSMFFRRSLVDRGFLFDAALKDVGDADWVERLLLADVRMATLPEPLGCFAFTGANRSVLVAAKEEGKQRAHKAGLTAGALRRLAVVFRHRMAKALSGAYLPRWVEIDVFTPTSGTQRIRMRRRVGFRWPTSKSDELGHAAIKRRPLGPQQYSS